MEITDRFQFTARRLLVCALIGALGAVAAAFVVDQQPAVYRAGATVFVGRVLASDQNSFAIAPLLADFETTVILPETVRVASTETKISTDDLYAGLTTIRDGQGTSVRVLFDAEDEAQAADAVRTVARVALERLAQQDVERADERLVRNKQKIRDIEAEIVRIQNETGIADFDTYFTSLTQDTFTLRTELATASAERKVALNGQLEARRQEAERLSDTRLQFNELRDEENLLRTRVTDAARASQDAQDRLVLAQAGGSIVSTGVEPVGRANDIARSAAAAFVLMAAIAAFVQFLLSERRRERLGTKTGSRAGSVPRGPGPEGERRSVSRNGNLEAAEGDTREQVHIPF